MLGLLGFVLLVVGAILTFFVSRLVGYAVLCIGSLLSAFGATLHRKTPFLESSCLVLRAIGRY